MRQKICIKNESMDSYKIDLTIDGKPVSFNRSDLNEKINNWKTIGLKKGDEVTIDFERDIQDFSPSLGSLVLFHLKMTNRKTLEQSEEYVVEYRKLRKEFKAKENFRIDSEGGVASSIDQDSLKDTIRYVKLRNYGWYRTILEVHYRKPDFSESTSQKCIRSEKIGREDNVTIDCSCLPDFTEVNVKLIVVGGRDIPVSEIYTVYRQSKKTLCYLSEGWSVSPTLKNKGIE